MLLDTTVLRRFRKRGEIHRFRNPQELELDVTTLSPVQAAQKVLEHVESVLRGAKEAAG